MYALVLRMHMPLTDQKHVHTHANINSQLQVQVLESQLRMAQEQLRHASSASMMSGITATPQGKSDFSLSTITPATRGV